MSPLLTRADWLEARLDAMPSADDLAARFDAEDDLTDAIARLFDEDAVHTSTTLPPYTLTMLGIAASGYSLEEAGRRWIGQARTAAMVAHAQAKREAA